MHIMLFKSHCINVIHIYRIGFPSSIHLSNFDAFLWKTYFMTSKLKTLTWRKESKKIKWKLTKNRSSVPKYMKRTWHHSLNFSERKSAVDVVERVQLLYFQYWRNSGVYLKVFKILNNAWTTLKSSTCLNHLSKLLN